MAKEMIRSLADELRKKIRQDGHAEPGVDAESSSVAAPEKGGVKPVEPRSKALPIKKHDLGAEELTALEELFGRIEAYHLAGNEKLLIRLDNRTVLVLKQLKLVKGIDMNKLIAYSLQYFLDSQPGLIPYLKHALTQFEL